MRRGISNCGKPSQITRACSGYTRCFFESLDEACSRGTSRDIIGCGARIETLIDISEFEESNRNNVAYLTEVTSGTIMGLATPQDPIPCCVISATCLQDYFICPPGTGTSYPTINWYDNTNLFDNQARRVAGNYLFNRLGKFKFANLVVSNETTAPFKFDDDNTFLSVGYTTRVAILYFDLGLNRWFYLAQGTGGDSARVVWEPISRTAGDTIEGAIPNEGVWILYNEENVNQQRFVGYGDTILLQNWNVAGAPVGFNKEIIGEDGFVKGTTSDCITMENNKTVGDYAGGYIKFEAPRLGFDLLINIRDDPQCSGENCIVFGEGGATVPACDCTEVCTFYKFQITLSTGCLIGNRANQLNQYGVVEVFRDRDVTKDVDKVPLWFWIVNSIILVAIIGTIIYVILQYAGSKKDLKQFND